MRKDKAGRPPQIADIQKRVVDLRGFDLSFTEIARATNLKSRQLARYHFLQAQKKLSTTKNLTKNCQRV